MNAHHFILATAGHVDHGKSALVKALTGAEPDRLPEEKARGMTIQLGFSQLHLRDEDREYQLGVIDVPGHEDFVKNMVAGVGNVDLAMLVVAADDGWMPQTEEHFQILTYLEVPRLVVALTKIDLAEDWMDTAAIVRERLQDSPYVRMPVIPVSTRTGEGIEDLRRIAAILLRSLHPHPDNGKPRLMVDRVFTVKGTGTVVTGTLTGGCLKTGDPVRVEPSGAAARIRAIQSHKAGITEAVPGMRVALNLPELEPGREHAGAGDGVARGDIVTAPGPARSTAVLGVRLDRSARLRGDAPGGRPLKHGTRVRLHHGTASVGARVYLPEGGSLLPGESGIAEIRAESPVFAFYGDRFILRDWQEQSTLGGGIVLDPDAHLQRFGSAEQQAFLGGCAQHPRDFSQVIASLIRRDGMVSVPGLLWKSILGEREILYFTRYLLASAAAASENTKAAEIVARGKWLIAGDIWDKLRRDAAEAIKQKHFKSPDKPGMTLSDLRSALGSNRGNEALFPLVVEELSSGEFVRAGNCIRHRSHRPALPPQLERIGKRLRAALGANPFDPPSRGDLAGDALAEQALRFLIQNHEVIELNQQVVILSEACSRAGELVREHLRRHERATVSELKQALGGSRRVVVPLLEYFDREGITRREGDHRLLRA